MLEFMEIRPDLGGRGMEIHVHNFHNGSNDRFRNTDCDDFRP